MIGEVGTTRAPLLGEPLPVELMNTVSIIGELAHDALADDREAAAWLRAVAGRIGAGFVGPTDDEARPVVGELRVLRDALRRLAAEATADPRPPATAPGLTRPEAIAALNAFAQPGPALVWPPGGRPARSYRTQGTPGVAVELIAHQGIGLLTGPALAGLRPCLAPNCLLFFARENTRREWCTPACGNRARVARHYRRHHRPA
jgi:predicted RNA-binding Zn ribbon-like protein